MYAKRPHVRMSHLLWIQWLRCSRFLFKHIPDIYATLLVYGCSEYVLSKEGETQGDPLSMLLYAVVVPVLPSSGLWRTMTSGTRIGIYADDSACADKLQSLCK